MRSLKYLFPLILLVGIVACKTLPLANQVSNLDRAVTIMVTNTDNAMLQGSISPAQAESVSKVAHQLNPLLDSARAMASAGDTAGANKTLTLVNSLLAGLQAFVPPTTP